MKGNEDISRENKTSQSSKGKADRYMPSQSSLMKEVKEELEGRERRRLRLVIAIPALMILITLSAGIISYELVLDMMQHTESSVFKTKLQGVANTILLANFIACGIALIFGVGLATYIIRPIRVLTQKARKIVKGELSTNISISNPDEIGELGESFNSLIDHLNHLFRERDRYILEGSSDGLVSIGAKREILALNTQAEKILGLKAEQVIGKNLTQVLGNFKADPSFNNMLQNSLANHESSVLEQTSFINSHGKLYNLSVSVSPIKDKQGNWMGGIISLRDLSFLDSFSEQIEQADRLAAIGSFATGIAHELRNPLGSIKGVAQLLGELGQEDKIEQNTKNLPSAIIQNYSKLIIGEVDRLDRVIRTILDFSQPDAEDSVPTNLNSVLNHALHLAMYHPTVESMLSDFTVEKDLQDIPECSLQKERITQALTNIILNAIQSVKPGGKVKIQSKAAREKNHEKQTVEIRIINDGAPILEEHREKIFEPFFTTRSDGTGLGLPISYQIVVSNQGTLKYQCDKGETAFLIHFPALMETKGTSSGYDAPISHENVFTKKQIQ